jgi:hypothetical protein
MADSMTAYAIKLKGTDKYLPILWRKRCGFSRTEPTNEHLPRLFPSLRSAQNGLTAWLQGEFKTEITRSGFYGEDEDVYTVPYKVEGRERGKMEIVKMVIREESI